MQRSNGRRRNNIGKNIHSTHCVDRAITTRGDVREGSRKDLETKKATVAQRSTQGDVKKQRAIIRGEFTTETLSKSGGLHS